MRAIQAKADERWAGAVVASAVKTGRLRVKIPRAIMSIAALDQIELRTERAEKSRIRGLSQRFVTR